MERVTTWSRPLCLVIVTSLVVPLSIASKDDWTEVDNMSGYSRIKVVLFPDHTDRQRKFTGNFERVDSDVIIINGDKPRNRLRIRKESIKRVAVERIPFNRTWFAFSSASIMLITIHIAFVAVPTAMLFLGPPEFRTIYRNTGKPPAPDPNDGPPVEVVKPGSESVSFPGQLE